MWAELIIDAGMTLPSKQPGPPVVALHAWPVLRGSRMLIKPPLRVEGLREIPLPLERRRHAPRLHALRPLHLGRFH